MTDFQAQLQQAEIDEVECRLIADLATDKKQRAAYQKLADYHHLVAAELRRVISTQRAAQ